MKDKINQRWINILIVVLGMAMTAVTTYYVGNAAQDAEIADLKTEVGILKVEVVTLKEEDKELKEMVVAVIKEVKTSNDKLQKLINLISAKWGIPIN